MASPSERRLAVRDAYRKFIGRNHYSQKLRNYYNKKYKDGRYYSDSPRPSPAPTRSRARASAS